MVHTYATVVLGWDMANVVLKHSPAESCYLLVLGNRHALMLRDSPGTRRVWKQVCPCYTGGAEAWHVFEQAHPCCREMILGHVTL